MTRAYITRACSLKAAVLFLATGAAGISAVWNWRHGWNQGLLISYVDAWLYAAMSAIADGFKASGLILVSETTKRFGRRAALAVFVAWIGCFGYSLMSALGYVATSRGDAVALRDKFIKDRKDAVAAVKRYTEALELLEKSKPEKPPHALQTDLQAPQQVVAQYGRKSDHCPKIVETTKQEPLKDACLKIATLKAQIDYFEQHRALREQLDEARREARKETIGSAGEADPIGSNIAAFFGSFGVNVDTATVDKWLPRFIVAVFELVACTGFLAYRSLDWPIERVPKKPAPVNSIVTRSEVKRTSRAPRKSVSLQVSPATRESAAILAALRGFDPALPPAGIKPLPGAWIGLTQRALAELAAVPTTCVHRELHSLADRGEIALKTTKRETLVRLLDRPSVH